MCRCTSSLAYSRPTHRPWPTTLVSGAISEMHHYIHQKECTIKPAEAFFNLIIISYLEVNCEVYGLFLFRAAVTERQLPREDEQ